MPRRPHVKHTRDFVIDLLRSVAIIVMIIMHVSPSYPRSSVANFIWNWGQWVVPAFILCSIAVDRVTIRTPQDYFVYLSRRLKRLLIPYYIWLVLYIGLIRVFEGKFPPASIILKNITLTGGYDFNWLIVLFIAVTAVSPLIRRIVERSEIQSLATLMVCFTTSAVYLGNRSLWSGAYRLYMIMPWVGVVVTIMLLLTWWKAGDRQRITALFIVAVGMFLYWYRYLTDAGISTFTFSHKYPPDIYFVSFIVWSVIAAYALAHTVDQYVRRWRYISTALTYVSMYSYRAFFIHILILYTLTHIVIVKMLPFVVFTLLLIALTGIVTAGTITLERSDVYQRLSRLRE